MATADESHDAPDTDDPDPADDTNTDDHDDSEGDDHDDPAADAGDGWTPPTREEWDRLTAAAEARKLEVRKLKARVRKVAPTKRAATSQPTASGAGQSDQADQATGDDPAAAELRAELERAKQSAVQASAVGVILAAGFQGDRAGARDLARLLDLADIDPDDIAEDDLEDAVDTLKARFPRLFEAPPADDPEPRPPARRPTTADRSGRARPAPADPDRRMSDRLLKQAGYR